MRSKNQWRRLKPGLVTNK